MKEIRSNLILLAVLVGIVFGIMITARFNLTNPTSGEQANDQLRARQEAGMPSSETVRIAQAISDAGVSVAERGIPAVVSLTVERKQRGFPNFDIFQGWYFPERTIQGTGSGFFVSPDGYLVTNYHVVAGAEVIRVKLADERELEGKLVGDAQNLDLAVVKVEGEGFPYLKLGDSDHIRVGEIVYAIGSPFGLRHTVTQGIISARDRVDMKLTQVEDFIQTDAAINPGNSGGPLINLHAEVIGVNTAINTRSGGNDGISFAIPSNVVRFAYERIKNGQKIEGAYIGVWIDDVDDDVARKAGLSSPMGCYIRNVQKGGPADTAGLKAGDIVTSVDDRRVRDRLSFFNMIYFHSPGDVVRLTVRRNGSDLDIPVTVTNRSEDVEKQLREQIPTTGNTMTIHGATVRLAKDNDLQGVVVEKVEDNSPAKWIGLQQGDIVLAIDRQKINTLDDFKRAFDAAIQRNSISVRIVRNMATLLLNNRGFMRNSQPGDDDDML